MIAILAFGSLLGDPGAELDASISERRSVQTPFCVEFARLSTNRGGAPTLVPVGSGGERVQASLLMLREDVSLQGAKDMLWRRETDRVGGGGSYRARQAPTPNTVLIKDLCGFEGINHVFFVDFPSEGKLNNPTAAQLADAAIESARGRSDNRDGISYLLNAKRSGIVTPLTADYECMILDRTGAADLEQARESLRAG